MTPSEQLTDLELQENSTPKPTQALSCQHYELCILAYPIKICSTSEFEESLTKTVVPVVSSFGCCSVLQPDPTPAV